MTEEINSKNLINFVKDFLHNKLIPVLKSEEIPEKQEGAVYKIVAKSFD